MKDRIDNQKGQSSFLAGEGERFLTEDVAGVLDEYEVREPQISLLQACAKTVEKSGMLFAEAGTGTGKTFAYLIPLILSGKKAIVSTKTINLQEQLVSKDLSFLSSLMEFPYAIAKGRGNYLCLRRFHAFRAEDEREKREYRALARWIEETESGDREDLQEGRSLLWEKVASDSDACSAMKCGHYRECFYYGARQKWQEARIIVANHALIGINGMMSDESKMLPDAEVLVVDEAHALDSSLSGIIGMTLSNRGFARIIGSLLRLDDRGTYRGLLSSSPHLFSPLSSLASDMELFWAEVRRECKDREIVKEFFTPAEAAERISAAINSFIDEIKTGASGLFAEDDMIELGSSLVKLRAFSDGLSDFVRGTDGWVRWVETEEGRTTLRMAPIFPAEFMRQHILSVYRSVIFTSATLSVGGDFSFISRLLGAGDAEGISLPSPFDLKNQITVEVKSGIDLKNDEGAGRLASVILHEASRKEGGMLVLFTSREAMRNTWDICSGELEEMGLNPMLQGDRPNTVMLRSMRQSSNSVIFGLDSFWEGVDVKGDALRSLVITKLPFEVPTEPVVMARTEMIEREGGNPFYQYSLPRAVLKFKQGVGRLIRSRTDTGRIIICDERIETARYGGHFRAVLPG